MSDATAKILQNFADKSFGNKERYIVDVDNPLPAGVTVNTLFIMENVTGFSCVDHRLLGNGTYPTSISAGLPLYSNYTDVSVESGKILCILN